MHRKASAHLFMEKLDTFLFIYLLLLNSSYLVSQLLSQLVGWLIWCFEQNV